MGKKTTKYYKINSKDYYVGDKIGLKQLSQVMLLIGDNIGEFDLATIGTSIKKIILSTSSVESMSQFLSIALKEKGKSWDVKDAKELELYIINADSGEVDVDILIEVVEDFFMSSKSLMTRLETFSQNITSKIMTLGKMKG